MITALAIDVHNATHRAELHRLFHQPSESLLRGVHDKLTAIKEGQQTQLTEALAGVATLSGTVAGTFDSTGVARQSLSILGTALGDIQKIVSQIDGALSPCSVLGSFTINATYKLEADRLKSNFSHDATVGQPSVYSKNKDQTHVYKHKFDGLAKPSGGAVELTVTLRLH